MRRLRAEMPRRMLGNGYCARPVEMDCHFEGLYESCPFFVTTIAFRPTLQQQRDDERQGEVGRNGLSLVAGECHRHRARHAGPLTIPVTARPARSG
jgi:hypothetical protein